MAGESKEGGGIPYSGIFGAILIVAAVAVQHARLDSARPIPADTKAPLPRTLHQDVEARLWHDPLALVAQFRERKRQEAIQEGQLRRLRTELLPPQPLPTDAAHSAEKSLKPWLKWLLCAKKADETEPVRLLMPMLVGGRDEESGEMRRRTRYAVVSGLINAKYNPDDADAIGYIHFSEANRSAAGWKAALPDIVPFEWFGRTQGDGTGKEWVLVLWLDQSSFQAGFPLAQVRGLVDALTPACDKGQLPVDRKALDATVLGPVDSEMLALLDRDLKAEDAEDKAPLRKKGAIKPRTPEHFVSASATASLSPQFFFETDGKAASFGRVVGPDEALIKALKRELELRLKHFAVVGDRSPATIVISEHDTNYGRDFAELMKTGKSEPEIFSYLRQIDGGRGAAPRSSRNPDKDKDGDKNDASQQTLRSHGTSQIDYLARLVRDVERYADEEKKDIVAVGIFGNDVYDKLLVLRALRPAFPKAQFVTTDLDARLLDAEEAQWARNMVVATNFGLTLASKVQGGASPFRDGYQTATYFAAWLFGGKCATEVLRRHSTDSQVPSWLQAPLLYEIGRNRPVPLENLGEKTVSLQECEWPKHPLNKATSVQIQPTLKRPAISGGTQFALSVLAGLALAAMVLWASSYPAKLQKDVVVDASATIRAISSGMALVLGYFACVLLVNGLTARFPQNLMAFSFAGIGVAICVSLGLWCFTEGFTRGRTVLVCAGAFLTAPALYLIAWAVTPAVTPNDEPFAWTEGVSVWPTQLLRAFAAVLAGFSLWYIGAASARSMQLVGDRFGLSGIPASPKKNGRLMSDVWNRYAGGRSWRIAITIGAALLYLVACFAIIFALDARPGVPLRGDHAPEVSALLGLAIFLGVILLAGMILGCGAFIFRILWPAQRSIPVFPDARVAEFRALNRLPELGGQARRFIDSCLSVDLVAERSESLVGLIYPPFAVFAIMAVARSPVFDNWDTPLGLLIVLGLPFVLVIVLVIWLYFETLAFHRKAMRKAQQELIRLRGLPEIKDSHLWQFERLYEKLRDEKRGSFQNILLQPMFRALLVPLGGISGIEVLDQFLQNR